MTSSNKTSQKTMVYSSHGFPLRFTAWMNLMDQETLSDQDEALFFQGLQHHPEWIHRTYRHQQTPLLIASDQGHAKIVKVLIQAGSDLNQTDEDDYTALKLALCKGHVEVAKTLIEAGADVNHQDENDSKNALIVDSGKTALMVAASKGCFEIVEALIEAGAGINNLTKRGRTALIFASVWGHVEVVKALVQKGSCLLNVQDDQGCTALIWASAKGHLEVVKELIRQGADPCCVSNRKETALYLARHNGCTNVVNLLEAYTESYLSERALSQALHSQESSLVTQSGENEQRASLKRSRL